MKTVKIVLAACLLVTGSGCAHSTAPPPPLITGAVNQFDQDSYKTLMAVQASLNSLKASVQTDPNAASLKAVLNQAIQDYNIADVAWQTYHAAAATASATSAQQAAVTSSLTTVQSDLSKAGR